MEAIEADGRNVGNQSWNSVFNKSHENGPFSTGCYQESSGATGVNGNQADNSVLNAGAAYVFVRRGTNWNQEAYLKASNPGVGDLFGRRGLSLSVGTVVIAAPSEDSSATGINGNQSDNSAANSGAVYVFTAVGVGPPISITPTGTGGYLLRLTGVPGLTYRVERASSLTDAWSLRSTLTAPASGLIQYYDLAPPPGQAFYRTVQP